MAATPPPSPSGLPMVGQTIDYARDPLELYDEVATKCGDIAQVKVLGLDEFYILGHPDHFKHALVESRDAFTKTEDFEIAFGNSVLTTENEQWRRHRSALEEFFYPEQIRSYADEMVSLTQRRIDRWNEGDVVSLRDEMNGVAMEILFGTLFDRRLDLDGDENLRRAAKDLNRYFKPTSFALPRWVPTPSRHRFHDAVTTLKSEVRSLLAECEQEGEGDDLLSALVEQRASGETILSDEEIVDQVVTLTFAGHDTTALALMYAFHQIGTHETIRERFHTELDDVLGDEPPTLADVSDLEVTERIIHETMRRYPSVHTLPRKTTRDIQLGDHLLRGGMRVHLAIWRVHRHEQFWDDPLAFKPARWRDTSPQEQGYAFVPFGAGPRACIGRRFALLEATLVLATVGQQYHLDPEREIELAAEMTTQPANRLPARVRHSA